MPQISAPNSASISQKHGQPQRIIALGDSLVYGYGDPVAGGWVEQLRRKWMHPLSPGHALYNLGIRGNGVIQVKERLEQEFRHRGELRNRYPDLIILSVGTNDSARLGRSDGKQYTEFAEFKLKMAELLDEALELCPVLFVGMVPVDESKMPFLDCFYYSHADQERYKEATRIACEQRGVPYLDIFKMWLERGEEWGRSRLCPDGLHPNVRGYQTLLEDVVNWEPITKIANC